MKVLVIGATGGTGRATLEELLEGGHEVTAFSRHADTQLEGSSPRLHRIRGDALNPSDVDRAVAGQDAVVVALGVNDNPLRVQFLHRSKTPVDVCSEGTRHAIEAMKRQNVRRLIVLSAFGVGETREKLPLPWKLAYRYLIRDQIADKEIQERLVRESGLDWVIVQPVGLTNARPHGGVLASTEGDVRKHTVTRSDVGHFLARLIDGTRYLHRSVAVSG